MARYVAELISYGQYVSLGKVLDTQEKRYICSSAKMEDATNIAKAMNVANSWDPILMTSEMEKG